MIQRRLRYHLPVHLSFALLLAAWNVLAIADDHQAPGPTGPVAGQSSPLLPSGDAATPTGVAAPSHEDVRAPLTITVTQTPAKGGQVVVSAIVESEFDSDDVTVTWDIPRAVPTVKDLSRGAIRRLQKKTKEQSSFLLAHPDKPYKIQATVRAKVPGMANTYFSQQAAVIVTPDGRPLRALPSDEEQLHQRMVTGKHGARLIQYTGKGGVNKSTPKQR